MNFRLTSYLVFSKRRSLNFIIIINFYSNLDTFFVSLYYKWNDATYCMRPKDNVELHYGSNKSIFQSINYYRHKEFRITIKLFFFFFWVLSFFLNSTNAPKAAGPTILIISYSTKFVSSVFLSKLIPSPLFNHRFGLIT